MWKTRDNTISTVNTIAFIMQLYEDGVLKKENLDGIAAIFGSKETLLHLAEKIGRNEGVGKILSDGERAAIQKLGLNSENTQLTLRVQKSPHMIPEGRGYGLSLFNI